MSPVLPLTILWTGGALALLMDGRRRGTGVFALVVTALAIGASVSLLADAVLRGASPDLVTGDWPAGIGIRLRADALAMLFTVVTLVSIGGALLYETINGALTRTFPAVMLLMATGLTGLFLTADAFNFYVFFELSMITSFVLTAYGQARGEMRAAVVFALVNLVGSVFLLAALAGIYRLSGTLDMTAVSSALEVDPAPALLVGTLVLVALGLKLGLFPFHFWLPAVYRGTRPVAAAVLSGAVANIGSYGLIRFGYGMFHEAFTTAAPVLIVIAAMTVVYGGVLAASRRAAQEVLGYSAIGQAGFVLLALSVGGTSGIAAAVLYAMVNSVNKTALFLCGRAGGAAAGTAFAIGALSVAGVPPTVGFVGKAELFRVAIDASSAWMGVLVVVGTGLSFVYMFQSFQHTHWATWGDAPARPGPERLVAVAVAVLMLAAGIWPEPLVRSSHAAALALVEGG